MHIHIDTHLKNRCNIGNATVVSSKEWTLPTQTLNPAQLEELLRSVTTVKGTVELNAGVLTIRQV